MKGNDELVSVDSLFISVRADELLTTIIDAVQQEADDREVDTDEYVVDKIFGRNVADI